jgi:hypothetical protein
MFLNVELDKIATEFLTGSWLQPAWRLVHLGPILRLFGLPIYPDVVVRVKAAAETREGSTCHRQFLVGACSSSNLTNASGSMVWLLHSIMSSI